MRARILVAGAMAVQLLAIGSSPLPAPSLTGTRPAGDASATEPLNRARAAQFLTAAMARGEGTIEDDALAVLALARSGYQAAAERSAVLLIRRTRATRSTALSRKTRALTLLALTASDANVQWKTVWGLAATIRDPRREASAASLALSAKALDQAAKWSLGRFHPFAALSLRLRADATARRLRSRRRVRISTTADALAPVAAGIVPARSGRRLLLALDHLGVFIPGLGARRTLVPGGPYPYAVDTASTLLYARAAAKAGLRRLAVEAFLDTEASMRPDGGIAPARDPVLGPRFGSPLGSPGMGPTADWLLTLAALRRVGDSAARLGGWPKTPPNAVFPHGTEAVEVRAGADSSRFIAWLLTQFSAGRRVVVFWNRPWPGFPAEPGEDLRHRRSMPLWMFGAAGPRFARKPAQTSPVPARLSFVAAAKELADRVDSRFGMVVGETAVLKESLPDAGVSARPSYLWPMSVWLGAEAASGRGRATEHWLPAVELYADPTRIPPAFTAAVKDPGGVEFFDDNGWLGLDAVEAYRVTHDSRWLRIAETIFRFMRGGWAASGDPVGGERFSTTNATRTETSTGTFLNLALELAEVTNRPGVWAWARRIQRFQADRMTEPDGLVADVLGPSGAFGAMTYPYDSALGIDADVGWYDLTRRPIWLLRARALAYRALGQYEDPVTGRIRTSDATDPAEDDAFQAIFLASLARLDQCEPESWLARPVLAEARFLLRHGQGGGGFYRADWTRASGSEETPPRLVTQAAALTVLAAAARVERVRARGR